MLLYNKSLDPYHAMLRFVSILVCLDKKVIESERLKIYDFLIANPFHIYKMSLKKELLSEKNKFKKHFNPYNKFDPALLFSNMSPIQDSVFVSLKEIGILLPLDGTTRHEIFLEKIPNDFLEIVSNQQKSVSKEVIDFIKNKLDELNLLGVDGLKASSKLMEYRYDAV